MDALNVWFARSPRPSGFVIAAYADAKHASREVVSLPPGASLLTDYSTLAAAEVLDVEGHPRVSRIHLEHRERYQGTSPLWFVLLDDSRAGVPALVLAAFADDRFPPGTLASPREAAARGANLSQRAGSLRWLPGSGAVHQIETSPDMRRQQVATRLLVSAELVTAAHGWPGLNGGEDRTQAGDHLLSSILPYASGRLAEWQTTPELTDIPSRMAPVA